MTRTDRPEMESWPCEFLLQVGCSPWGRKESDTTEQLNSDGTMLRPKGHSLVGMFRYWSGSRAVLKMSFEGKYF